MSQRRRRQEEEAEWGRPNTMTAALLLWPYETLTPRILGPCEGQGQGVGLRLDREVSSGTCPSPKAGGLTALWDERVEDPQGGLVRGLRIWGLGNLDGPSGQEHMWSGDHWTPGPQLCSISATFTGNLRGGGWGPHHGTLSKAQEDTELSRNPVLPGLQSAASHSQEHMST